MIILLTIHILFSIACLPLILFATFLKYRGNNNSSVLAKYSSYSLIGILTTGSALVLAFHANLVSSCYAGLTYSALFAISYLAYAKLVTVKSK